MAQSGVVAWSQTAASNGTADSSVNFAEGMAPSAVNDSARALMASVAKYRDDNGGALATSGTSTAYTLTTNQNFSTLAYLNGQTLAVRFDKTNGDAPTLNVDSLGAKPIYVDTSTAVGNGVIKANSIRNVTYDSSNNCFILQDVPAKVQDATVNTASIVDNAVTLAKLATQADQTLLGNISGATAVPTAITIGAGLSAASGVIRSAFPPAAAFKNLSIKVASNTTVTVAADYVTTTDGTSFQTTAVSSTVNLGTTGADALDTGTIATSTWYAIWVIAKSDGTTKCVASTSTSSPTLPSGYTYKARVGWVRTASGSAQLLGTWQFGRDAHFVLGLAQTTALQRIVSGSAGNPSDASISWFATTPLVPSTASSVHLMLCGTSAGLAQVAPNSSYGGYDNGSQKRPPLIIRPDVTGNMSDSITLMLESSNVYYASTNSGAELFTMGWQDNI